MGNISKIFAKITCCIMKEKGNHVLVMAFARWSLRGNVHCYNNTVELALFLFIFEMNL